MTKKLITVFVSWCVFGFVGQLVVPPFGEADFSLWLGLVCGATFQSACIYLSPSEEASNASSVLKTFDLEINRSRHKFYEMEEDDDDCYDTGYWKGHLNALCSSKTFVEQMYRK